jgi:pSer/pThr/pTyr-binding forkhead associated (FHA) protein
MASSEKVLGVLRPLGGGDPAELTRETIVVGRRPTCDVILDFEKISGRHCELRLVNNVWHVKDLGSTNGTTVNGQKITSPTSVMPDIELGIADRIFHLDYEPAGPASFVEHHGVMDDDEIQETRKKTSLMEMAGLDTDNKPAGKVRPTRPPARIERLSADEADFEDALPEHVKAKPAKKADLPSDDDFFNLIEDEIKK